MKSNDNRPNEVEPSLTLHSVEDLITSFKCDLTQASNTDCNILVVGSSALKAAGFDVKINDVDLEILVNENNRHKIDCILRMMTIEHNNEYPGMGLSNPNRRFLTYRGIKVDVWLVSNWSHDTIFRSRFSDDIYYAGVMSILKAKASYYRNKDVKSIIGISNAINTLLA